MTRLTTYPGKANSLPTTLSAPIDDDDDTLPVTECSEFDAGENEAVLGEYDDPDAETVLYADKSAASGPGNLTGVTRAFEGSAKSWPIGTTISRRFTAYDYDAVRQNQDVIFDELPMGGLFRNALVNGNFDVWQRGTSFTAATVPANNDDTYLPDRWILLSDGNDIVDVSRESTVIPAESTYSLKCEVETANKKFGWLQIIEAADAIKFAGKTVSLSFQARTTTDKLIENLRAAVISWSSTADVVTSDVVSAWNAEGADPTLAANWTYENTPSNLALSTAFQTFTIEGISVDTASMKNLAVFIWVDDTDAAVDDLLYLGQVQICAGDIAVPYQPRSYAEETVRCKRYWRQSYNLGVGPGTATTTGQHRAVSPGGNYAVVVNNHIDVLMRVAPTITVYSPNSGDVNKIYNASAGTDIAATVTGGENTIVINVSNVTTNAGQILSCQWVANAEL